MSNNYLIAQMELAVNSAKNKLTSLACLVKLIRGNGCALERMPYNLIREMDPITRKLEIASWQEADGFLSDAEEIFCLIDKWLSRLPR